MSVLEARNFVKYLLLTVKICSQNISTAARSQGLGRKFTKNDILVSYAVDKERDIMENLLKYGLMCMDVFMLSNPKRE